MRGPGPRAGQSRTNASSRAIRASTRAAAPGGGSEQDPPGGIAGDLREPGKALDRLPPGHGQVRFREIFGIVQAKGYAGYLSYEAPNPAAWARKPEDVAAEARAATLAVLP